MNLLHKSLNSLARLLFFLLPIWSFSQTPINGFYHKKNELTIATTYTAKSYDQFYRGTTLTDGNPAGFGKISSSIFSFFGEYGITDWLSTTVTLPHISIKSNDGAIDPVQGKSKVSGLQDLQLFLKVKAFEKKFKDNSNITIGAAAGTSIPVGGYDGRGILSIGTDATTFDGSAVLQYTTSFNLFTEVQAGYSLRNNSDYDVPNAFLSSFKVGYFNDSFYAHAKIGLQNSTSGFDIGSDEFVAAGGPSSLPQTEVDFTNLHFGLYVPLYKNILGISSGYGLAIDGRNYNKESTFSFGAVYKLY
ncbi:hypothetical protein HN014_08365 [Aquimarina sp. TRL1]|uniref:transporter n=1 Tax=Aquimarina sp. (strain TRL1) TaxID=2736252 RepID=UPI00158CBE08|nr:transporter [Aquimarina sp. TRL1]QKX04931.1 hypothetical protein HN014_08365 [Aquimarina sp. TRL1]